MFEPYPIWGFIVYIIILLLRCTTDTTRASYTHCYHRDVHTHATRHQNDPKPPKANSDLLARSFICKAPIIWMNLDQSIRNANSKSTFKRIIKKSMISHY